MELIDRCYKDGRVFGKPVSKDEIHRKGYWHRTIHLWVVTPDRQILLQRRASTKDCLPDFWDTSVAGHMTSGESSLDCAVRETFEELGLRIQPTAPVYQGIVRQNNSLNNGAYIDRELVALYFLVIPLNFADLRPSKDEVAELRSVSAAELRLMIDTPDSKLVPHPEEYSRLLDFVNSAALPNPEPRVAHPRQQRISKKSRSLGLPHHL